MEKIVAKYDKYSNISTVIKHPCTRSTTKDLPDGVPMEFMGLWLLVADQEMPHSPKKMEVYEDFIPLQVRPPPIYSPDQRSFAIQCAPDPTFYSNQYKPVAEHRFRPGWKLVDCGCVQCVPVFGSKFGLMTDMGVIAMPTELVHGYCWEDKTATWVIATGV